MASKLASSVRHKTVPREFEGGLEHETTDKDDVKRLFSEVRQNYSAKLADDDEYTLPRDTSIKDAQNAISEAIEKNLNDANAEKEIYCASCSTAVRVEYVSRFARGQQISMPGNYSKLFTYRHHAIVRNVIERSGTRVTLELIEFNKIDFKKNIYKSTKTFDLKKDDMCIIEYTHPRYTADEIVQRAESMLQENMTDETEFGSYNPFSNNCEHFATWCVVGEGKCLQLHDIRHTINEKMSILQQFLNGHRIFRYLSRFLLNSTDEIGGAVSQGIGGLKQGITLGVTAGVYFLYCIIMTCVYVHEKKQGHMCQRCLNRKLWDIWLDLFTFCAGSIASYLIIIFAVPLISPVYVFPLAILVILLAIGLQWSVSKVNIMLQSPFPVDKTEIRTLSEIDVGDVISMKYWGIPHDMIVTEVSEQNESKGTIQCVHYGLPTWNIFGTRKILDEPFQVDLTKYVISKYDCGNLLTYKKEVVVSRAKKRVEETKWNRSSNRSDHFCYWAKVKQFEDADCDDLNMNHEIEPKKLELTCLVKKEIHLFNELQLGDTLEFGEKGILVGKTCLDGGYGRKFEIEMLVNSFIFGVRCKRYNIDLNIDKLTVNKFYTPVCLPMKERVERAKIAHRGSERFLSTTRFLEFCILLPTFPE